MLLTVRGDFDLADRNLLALCYAQMPAKSNLLFPAWKIYLPETEITHFKH